MLIWAISTSIVFYSHYRSKMGCKCSFMLTSDGNTNVMHIKTKRKELFLDLISNIWTVCDELPLVKLYLHRSGAIHLSEGFALVFVRCAHACACAARTSCHAVLLLRREAGGRAVVWLLDVMLSDGSFVVEAQQICCDVGTAMHGLLLFSLLLSSHPTKPKSLSDYRRTSRDTQQQLRSE